MYLKFISASVYCKSFHTPSSTLIIATHPSTKNCHAPLYAINLSSFHPLPIKIPEHLRILPYHKQTEYPHDPQLPTLQYNQCSDTISNLPASSGSLACLLAHASAHQMFSQYLINEFIYICLVDFLSAPVYSLRT